MRSDEALMGESEGAFITDHLRHPHIVGCATGHATIIDGDPSFGIGAGCGSIGP